MADQQPPASRISRIGLGLGLGAGSSAVLGYVLLAAFSGVAGATALLIGLPALSHTSFGRMLLSSVAHVSVGPALPTLSFDVSSISTRLGGSSDVRPGAGGAYGGTGGAPSAGGTNGTGGGSSGAGGFGSAGSGSYTSGGASGTYVPGGGFVPGNPPVGAPGSNGTGSNSGSSGPSAGSGAGAAGIPGSSATISTDLIPPGVPVHSERVGASYAAALDAATSTFIAFENDNLDNLVPLLNQIYTEAAAGNYTSILPEMDQARSIITREQGTLATFGTNLSALSSASVGAPATVVNSTNALVIAGVSLKSAANAYLDTLEGALSGSLPSQATLDDISAKVNALGAANDAFKQALANVVLALNALPS